MTTASQNGVKTIIEVPVGIDGLTIIEANNGPAMNLTQADIYKALAANPFGKGPNTAQTWKDVNPSLPAIKIRVLGPPPTSGTRDSLADLYLTKGCDTDPAMKALAKSERGPAQADLHQDPRGRRLCRSRRERQSAGPEGRRRPGHARRPRLSPTSSRMPTRCAPVKIAGIAPTEETIADLTYPGARKLYIYLKGEHMQAKPKMRDFVAAYAKMWGKGGPLERVGLVPFGGADATAAAQQASDAQAARPERR